MESTLLVRNYLRAGYRVVPMHVHCGLIWDDTESQFARRFCESQAVPNLEPMLETRVSLQDTLGTHWAVTGRGVPRAGAPSSELEIPLRNLTLLGFASFALRPRQDVSLAVGTTRENDYRDGSREYFDRCSFVLSIEFGRPLQILTPVITWSKTEVIQASDRATLAASFSCVDPCGGKHCGACIKCGKRRTAFRAAGVEDPTEYAVK